MKPCDCDKFYDPASDIMICFKHRIWACAYTGEWFKLSDEE